MNKYAPVAQMDRAAVYGTAGHEFESCPARHFLKEQLQIKKRKKCVMFSSEFMPLVVLMRGFFSTPGFSVRNSCSKKDGKRIRF